MWFDYRTSMHIQSVKLGLHSVITSDMEVVCLRSCLFVVSAC